MAYESVGFSACDGPELESGYEKIAIYTSGGEPKHASRQLPNGRWTSKLGRHEDIEHALDGVNSPAYGVPAAYMKRATVASAPKKQLTKNQQKAARKARVGK
jgi:hypothetical protein